MKRMGSQDCWSPVDLKWRLSLVMLQLPIHSLDFTQLILEGRISFGHKNECFGVSSTHSSDAILLSSTEWYEGSRITDLQSGLRFILIGSYFR